FQFSPNGNNGGQGTITVGSLDWLQGNSVNMAGNPAGGLTPTSSFLIFTQSKLNSFVDANGQSIPVPAGTEFTFIMGVPVTVQTLLGTNSPVYKYNGGLGNTNFVEMWVSAPDVNMLNGTGFNNGKRILYGVVRDGFGSLSISGCPEGA